MASEADLRARLQRAPARSTSCFLPKLAPEPAPRCWPNSRPWAELRQHCQRAAAACAAPGPPSDLAARLQPLPPERVGSATEGDPRPGGSGRRKVGGGGPGGRRRGRRKGPRPRSGRAERGARGSGAWAQFAFFVKSPALSHVPARVGSGAAAPRPNSLGVRFALGAPG